LIHKLAAFSRNGEQRPNTVIMDAYATKKDVQEIVDKAVTDLSEIISTFAQQVDTRFNKIEEELSELR